MTVFRHFRWLSGREWLVRELRNPRHDQHEKDFAGHPWARTGEPAARRGISRPCPGWLRAARLNVWNL
jgi:hypothetical protein